MKDVFKFTQTCTADTCHAFFGSNISQVEAKKARDEHMDTCHDDVVRYVETVDGDNMCAQYKCMAGAEEDGGIACDTLIPGKIQLDILKLKISRSKCLCPNTFKFLRKVLLLLIYF